MEPYTKIQYRARLGIPCVIGDNRMEPDTKNQRDVRLATRCCHWR